MYCAVPFCLFALFPVYDGDGVGDTEGFACFELIPMFFRAFKADGSKGTAHVKRMMSEAFYAVGDVYVCKGIAIEKCTLSDRSNTVRDGNAG